MPGYEYRYELLAVRHSRLGDCVIILFFVISSETRNLNVYATLKDISLQSI